MNREINEKFKSIANGKNKNLAILGFERLNNLLLEVDGELLSNYYDVNTSITVRMYNAICTRTPSNIITTVKKIKETVKYIENNDDIVLDIYNNKRYIMFKIKTFDGAIIDKTINAYYKFNKARYKLIKLLKNNKHDLLSPYISEKDKVLIDFNCGHKPNFITPNSYKNGVRCPVCCGQKTEIDINDINTTHPELLKYFVNTEDSKLNSIGSKTYINFKCAICGHEKKMLALNLLLFGFSCPKCGDGISYPNKFMFNLLEQLGEKFNRESKFDWCIFGNYENKNKTNYGIYDFVVEDKKIIIEMDGNLGHGTDKVSITNISKNESSYKDLNKDILAKQHGYDVIRIDCRYRDSSKRFNYVKNSILQSKLSLIYDLSNINWNNIHLNSLDSLVNNVCMLWNENKDIKDIIKKTKLSNTTVLRYLKEGALVGLCDYTYEESIKIRSEKVQKAKMKPIKIIKDNTTFYCSSTKKYIIYYNKKYQVKLDYESIRLCLTNKKSSYKGFIFNYITREEFNTVKQTLPELAFGDFFILSDSTNQQSA